MHHSSQVFCEAIVSVVLEQFWWRRKEHSRRISKTISGSMAFINQLSLLGALICSLILITESYPSGPPTSVCTSQTPRHGTDSQNGQAPYTISLDANTYSPGQTIRITISGNDANINFRGFFLQARRKDEFRDTTQAIGSFTNAPAGTKLLTCDGTANSAWSHSDNSDKNTVSIDWVAPNGFEGKIAFKSTVVQGPATVFYENILSNIIFYDGPTPVPTSPGTGGQASAQPITFLLVVVSGLLSLLFLWQRV